MFSPIPTVWTDHADASAWFAVCTLPPLAIGVIARSRIAVGLIAAAHALVPLSLTNAMKQDDLNPAMIV